MRKIFVLYVAFQSLFIMIVGCGCKQKLEQRDYYAETQEIADTYLNSTKDTTRYESFKDCLDKWKETRIFESFWTTVDSIYNVEDVYFKRERGGGELAVYSINMIAKGNKGYFLAESDVSLPDRVRVNAKIITKAELHRIMDEIENKYVIFTLQSDLGSRYMFDASCGFITMHWSGGKKALLYYDVSLDCMLMDNMLFRSELYTINQVNIGKLNMFVDSLFYY